MQIHVFPHLKNTQLEIAITSILEINLQISGATRGMTNLIEPWNFLVLYCRFMMFSGNIKL